MYDIKLIVFDWDGTLMDSETQIVACMQAAIADLALESRNDEQVKNIIGLGLHEAVAGLYPEADATLVRAVADRYRVHWLAGDQPSPLFPGVEATLQLLKQEGFRLAVATGKGRSGLDKVLRETGLAPMFDATRCSDETRSKPHPLMLEQLMQELNFAPTQTLMIGDTEYDMEMARNAGTHAVAVAYGVHACPRLQRHAPLTCLDQITELGDWLAELDSLNAPDLQLRR
ncbi:MAG: HAD-IA family hydrolase [Gammaproteobacteria bacterium]|nr:HAD-IA family hydrolase [Gammaproteobacteria bacterium]